jgi:putative ABC transport system permease protein
VLKETALTTSGGVHRARLRNGLVMAEVALTVMLLVGAGLSIRSLDRVLSVAPGFETRSAVTVRTSLPNDRYPTPERQAAFFQRAVEAITARPGIQAAGAIFALPLTGSGWSESFDIPGREQKPEGPPTVCSFRPIAGDYFRAMGIPVLRGQGFGPGAHDEMIVDTDFARKYFPNEDPIGRDVVIDDERHRRIVGVTGSVKDEGLETSPTKPMVYVPASDVNASIRSMTFVVRTSQAPEQASADLERTVWNLDRDLPLYDAAPLTEVFSKSAASPRTRALLLGLFAALAVFLAAVGIYGLVSHGVSQRTHEIGLRVALGAPPGHVVGVVIREGMGPVLVGLAVGLAGALALSRLIQSQLYGVRATDPATYAVIAVLISVVALAAMCVPIRRALTLDPVVALRYE